MAARLICGRQWRDVGGACQRQRRGVGFELYRLRASSSDPTIMRRWPVGPESPGGEAGRGEVAAGGNCQNPQREWPDLAPTPTGGKRQRTL